MHLVTAMNISEYSALPEGVGQARLWTYNGVKAKFVVVWAGRPGPPHERPVALVRRFFFGAEIQKQFSDI
jgi:hypothetical protein